MPITPPKNNPMEEYLRNYARELRGIILGILEQEAVEVVDMIKLDVARGGYRKYKDQSGNLTSSIGFVLLDNGQILREYGFEPALPTATEGADAGRNYATQLAAEYPRGLGVIIVAGMNYAAYVEARNLGGMTAGEQALRNAIHIELQDLVKQLKAKM